MIFLSALNATGSVAGGEGFDLRDGDLVEIVFDRVLEAARRDREVDRGLRRLAREERVDESAAERVAANRFSAFFRLSLLTSEKYSLSHNPFFSMYSDIYP